MGRIIFTALILFIFTALIPSSFGLVLGDYAAPPRLEDKSVNNELLVDFLKNESVNTYAYLIWDRFPDRDHEIDWIRFKEFLPLAQENKINVYAYLIPPTGRCETILPYECDFEAWGEEIANLSLQYSVLKGFIIDDFLGARNDKYFTREYTNNFITISKEINSELEFFPIVYYQEIISYMKDYRDLSTGIIYPYIGMNPVRNLNDVSDEREFIENMNEILKYNGKIISFNYPWSSPSHQGDYAILSKTVNVPENIEELDEVNITFIIGDDFEGGTSGYHYIQLLIDGEIVWEKDVANLTTEKINLNLKNYIVEKQQATISFRAMEKRAVYNFGVNIHIININGIVNSYDFSSESNSNWGGNVVDSKNINDNHKLIVMIYANWLGGIGYKPSPEYILDATNIVIDAYNDGLSEGVILYALTKSNNDNGYNLIKELYFSYRNNILEDQLLEDNQPQNEPQNQVSGGGSGGGGGGSSRSSFIKKSGETEESKFVESQSSSDQDKKVESDDKIGEIKNNDKNNIKENIVKILNKMLGWIVNLFKSS